MRFDTPAETNPIDQGKVVGRAVTRIDGPVKVTGTATYAYEWHDPSLRPAYGYPVGASIAKGRIISMDLRAAKAASGVIAVVTASDVGQLGKGNWNTANLLGGPEIQHYHQAIAVVVAETFEQARAAASLVRVEYEAAPGNFDLHGLKDTLDGPPDVSIGEFDSAFEAAPVKLDAVYSTPDHSHVMMEPHATLAAWDGDELIVWTSNQMIGWGKRDLAKTLGIDAEKIQMKSPFVGGGFGGKLFVRADVVLAAIGARAARRAVKLALPRPFSVNNTTHRPATIQRIRIGAGTDGKIIAIAHESWSGNLDGGRPEAAVEQTRLLYAGANRMMATRLGVLDLPEGHAMRAPGEAPGLMALEIAIDEIAEKLSMDPVEFRIVNDTQTDPEDASRQFSQRNLIGCLRRGAEQFGWKERSTVPGRRRDGQWLIGMGVAVGFRDSPVMTSGARASVDSDGLITIETDMTDIGTGSYTIIAQTAAETMGVVIDRVTVVLGDSRFPVSAGSGGQWGANSSTSGVYAACVALREALLQKAGLNSSDAQFVDGEIRSAGRSLKLAEVAGEAGVSAEDRMEFGDLGKRYQVSTFAGHFVEVGVNVVTGETRIRRMLAVCSAGRILNPITARSQVIGGMAMGIGAALSEELAVDRSRGFFVNHDLAGYEVAVHADVPHQEVEFLDETDPLSSPMKAKGVGELGLCGVAAAIANAVYNATGVRVRHYPLTLDKLINELPPIG